MEEGDANAGSSFPAEPEVLASDNGDSNASTRGNGKESVCLQVGQTNAICR